MTHKPTTWCWVLTANFGEGLPYTIVNTVMVALLADMGIGNGPAAMIPSLLALPWMWKFLWSPFVDTYSTKRRWMIAMQVVIAAVLAVMALSLGFSWWLAVVVSGSALAALASATYDVACDGYYMLALPPKDQAFFVGIRSTAYRLGMLFGSGFLLMLADDGSVSAWQQTFLISAALMLMLALVHKWLFREPGRTNCIVPCRETDNNNNGENAGPDNGNNAVQEDETSKATAAQDSHGERSLREVLTSFLRLHHGRELLFMLLFIFTYRLGEAFLTKVTMLFLKDSVANGGLGLDNGQYGFLYGTLGTLFLTIGGILGGICISRWGLARCIIPMVICLDVPDLLYVWLSNQALTAEVPSLFTIGACVSIEQLGYGFGFSAFMIYLLECAKGPYETSHYAFLTALMAFGLLVPSTLSGYVQEALDSYLSYFILVCVLTVPGIIMSVLYYVKASRAKTASH